MQPEIRTFINGISAIEANAEIKRLFPRPNYFSFPGKQTLLAIKISRKPKAFFQISKKVIDYANECSSKFYLILLTSENSGWLYTLKEVNANVKSGYWNYREADGQYKIGNEHFDDRNRFSSYEKCLRLIEEKGGK